MHEANASDCLLTHPPSSGDCASADPILNPPEPLPDPASPEHFGNPNPVLVYAASHSEPAGIPAIIHHILSNNMIVPSASIALKPSDQIVAHKKPHHLQVNLNTYTVSASRSSSTQSLVDCGTNSRFDGSDGHVIHKTHYSVYVQGINNNQMMDVPIAIVGSVISIPYGEASAVSSQFGYASLGTSFSAQLACYKHFATNLVIASGANFLPFLPAFLSAVSIACDRPHAAPDPHTRAIFSTSGNFLASAIDFETTLVHHHTNSIQPVFQ